MPDKCLWNIYSQVFLPLNPDYAEPQFDDVNQKIFDKLRYRGFNSRITELEDNRVVGGVNPSYLTPGEDFQPQNILDRETSSKDPQGYNWNALENKNGAAAEGGQSDFHLQMKGVESKVERVTRLVSAFDASSIPTLQ